jgi:putative PEP-CTERM system TPR-repeat lipoprotein
MTRRASNQAIRASLVLTTLMLAAGLSGCGKAESSASLMADAKQYQQKGDNKAALIQLKNAASKSPEDGEVRLQLAALNNEMGDAVSAEKESRKAASLGIDAARTAPELAKALLALGQAQKAIDETAPSAAKGSAQLLASRGDAYLTLGDPVKAKESYQQALTAKPGYADAMLGMARLAIFEKDIVAANALVEQAISANPKNAAVWFFKGTLMRGQGKTAEAIAAYGQSIAINPDSVNARTERAMLEIGNKQFDAAKADIDAAHKASPNAPMVNYTQAVLDFTQGKFPAARESLQKVQRVAPDHMPTILLSGATDLSLGNLEQAEQQLKKYLEKNPDNAYARNLLAQAMLKGSKPVDAVATLAPLLKDGTQDAQVLALAGESSLRARDYTKATQYFEQASQLKPDVASLHTSLGMAKLAQGEHETAIKELERGATMDPKSESAGVALVRAEVGLKHYDKALAAVRALVAAQPQSALMRNLEGGVHMAKGDRAAARASFEKAASLDPALLAPVSNLVQMDMQDKKVDAAKQRLTAFLDKNKKSSEAMVMMGNIAFVEKRPEEATTWLEKANAENPAAIGPAKLLALQYMRTEQKAKALTLVRKLQTADPANPELLDLLGQTQLANNDAAGALETYSKLVNAIPKSAPAQLRLAVAHVKMNNPTAAADDLKKALALDPNFMQAKVAQIELAASSGKFDEALSMARNMQKSDPKSIAGYVLEGDILARQNKMELASRAYEQAFSIKKTPQVLSKLVFTLKGAGKTKEADAKMTQWQKDHPADPLAGIYFGESYLANKQYKLATDQFEAALKSSPDNPIALNNLAWGYQQQKDPRALATAEHAFKVAPESPAVLDTLGWMLVQQGNVARGLPLVQKAVALQPAAPELRYHLAFALNQSGDKKAARQELEKLLSTNKEFAQADEAKALLKTL